MCVAGCGVRGKEGQRCCPACPSQQRLPAAGISPLLRSRKPDKVRALSLRLNTPHYFRGGVNATLVPASAYCSHTPENEEREINDMHAQPRQAGQAGQPL